MEGSPTVTSRATTSPRQAGSASGFDAASVSVNAGTVLALLPVCYPKLKCFL